MKKKWLKVQHCSFHQDMAWRRMVTSHFSLHYNLTSVVSWMPAFVTTCRVSDIGRAFKGWKFLSFHEICMTFLKKKKKQFSGQFIKFPKLKQKSMTLTSVVTLTFDPRSWKIDKVTPGYQFNVPSQNKVNPTNGLGGVRGHTYIHTDRGLTSIII